MRLFTPLLPGTTLRDRLLACIGALVGITLAGTLSFLVVAVDPFATMVLVAPMGASAVLVFAVPASPLAQPWPVIGGNTLSALVGIAVAATVPVPALAAGVAVALAILVMSLTRSLHPPGGAAALLAVLGGASVAQAGWHFAFVPVMLNAAVLTGAGLLFHRISGQSYPHRPRPAPFAHPHAVERALEDMGESLDVAREDIDLLLSRVAHHMRDVKPERPARR